MSQEYGHIAQSNYDIVFMFTGDVVGVEWRQGGVVRFNNKNRCRANDVKHLIHAYPSSTHSKTTPVYFGEHTKCGQYQIHALVNQ